jgi:predicted RecA/RadA family phage recombinase
MIEAQTQGVFDLTKEPALAIGAGVRVFWDNTNRRITATAAGNFQVGIATQAALAAGLEEPGARLCAVIRVKIFSRCRGD